MVFKNCFGMIMSVSTLIMGSGAATLVRDVNFSIINSFVSFSFSANQLRRKIKQPRALAGQPRFVGGDRPRAAQFPIGAQVEEEEHPRLYEPRIEYRLANHLLSNGAGSKLQADQSY